MRVLVTIGSMSEKKFTRLFKIMDEICEEGIIDGKQVVAQVGFDGYKSKYYDCFDMTSDENFKRMIDESDLIITHAGTGTVTSSIKRGKKVIVFPRLVEYDEHYDNHQIELAESFSKQGYVLVAKTKEELKKQIQNIDLFDPTPFISNNDRISNMIIDFIEK
ncbi:MAG: capsular biosynthesis protein CpsG [Butyrivibrio sp.]|nr:capsular biosynthesis protein CpsG [Butyrivibrio sp.]